jgi:hypothetical protein
MSILRFELNFHIRDVQIGLVPECWFGNAFAVVLGPSKEEVVVVMSGCYELIASLC